MRLLKEEIFYFWGRKIKYNEIISTYPCATCVFYIVCTNKFFAFYNYRIKYLRRCGIRYNYKEIYE